MVEVEIDGRKVEVAEGSMLMHAANKLDIYIPHFCYHRKLSIAANCRMCLVEVEKAPKPLPACATPVTPGMKAYTRSDKAIKAQQSVMEFLLINHPLDCPICDQGGECQLQDLAVGYGGSGSRYHEEKRVVFHKNIGPLVAAEEMSRCIQCTRCVRFGQEIAGQMELGMAGRGEHSEIMSFLGRSIDSELSGNMIDICPVGALTSKPFRYSARTWELTRRRSIAPHDSLGSNLMIQVKQDRVMRVLPLENPSVNEMWLSDRDRFSYEGIHSQDRLTKPMLKQDGRWIEVEWAEALEYAARALLDIKREYGAEHIGGLVSGNATVEEMWLAQGLLRGLGSDNIDFRLRQTDFSLDQSRAGVPWLGMQIEEVDSLDSLFVIGSFLRKDHPLLSARVRGAARSGTAVMSLHGVADDWLMPMSAQWTLAPDQWAAALIEILVACSQIKAPAAGVAPQYSAVAPSETARGIADALCSGEKSAVLLGNSAVNHPAYGQLARLVQQIARVSGAKQGVIGDSANTVGGYLTACLPGQAGGDGLNARSMLSDPRKAYLLLGVEPTLDCGDPVAAAAALGQAATVIALTPWRSADLEAVADCLLPIGTFAETSGTFVNCEGRIQPFNGVIRPVGQARPGWKVLRVLGNQLGLSGFDQDSAEEVRRAAIGEQPDGMQTQPALDNTIEGEALPPYERSSLPLQRLADVPSYAADMLVRRAESLQLTREAKAPVAWLRGDALSQLGAKVGDRLRLTQDGQAIELEAARDDRLAQGVVRVSAAHPSTAALARQFGAIEVERVQ